MSTEEKLCYAYHRGLHLAYHNADRLEWESSILLALANNWCP